MPASTMVVVVVRVIGAMVIAATLSHPAMQTAAGQEEQLKEETPGGRSETDAEQARDSWPDNEPAGMTPILEVNGSSKDFGPNYVTGRDWRDDKEVRIVRDPASKYGHAIEKRFFVGDKSGWHGIIHTGDFGVFRELYFRQVVRVSENWQWHRSGGKYFYYGAAGRKRNASPTQFILGWSGSGKTRWIDSGVGEYRPNGGPEITRDVYHTIEIHHVARTSGANGSLRMWIDGVEIKSFNLLGDPTQNNVSLVNREWHGQRNLADKGLTGIQAFMYWGGQGDTKRVDDWVRLSELYISGRK